MFGFIKKLIAGILGFITGLLPKKKSNGYFLELDEASAGKSPQAEAAKETSPKVADKPASVSNGTKAAVVDSPEPAPSAAPSAKRDAPTATTATKATTAKKEEPSKNGKAPKAEPAKVPAATKAPKTPVETTFAPKYLAPSATGSNGRRRPGANMSNYLDMARQVKTPG
ncbi:MULTISPECIES: hypothetical protein [unclassified Anabaena]|uniref:hypothetical protein n=1 Tax=unclassified Anabaena TaxID=2619674 RepID=UPI0039C68B42